MSIDDFKIKDMVALTALFLLAFWLWTLPIQENPMPFGEHDAAYIFSYGDDMTYKDKSPRIAGDSPTSIDFWYAGYNKVLGPRALEYPPPYMMGYSFAQIFGGERIVPAYIFIAITCFIGMFSMYLLIRKLYGFEAALITSMAVLFSYRTILLYLWGQRHNITAFVYIPIAIYALYKYLDLFYKNKEKIVYLYIFTLLFLCTYLIHLSALVFLTPFAGVLAILMSIKHKQLPINKRNMKHYAALTVVLVVVILQFHLIYSATTDTNIHIELGLKDFGSLFRWIKIPDNNFGMNPAFHNYKTSYIGHWTLPLLFVGVIVLFLKRKNEDLVIISSLAALYIMFHLPAFGLAKFEDYRIGRFLIIEGYFFYTTMAIGLISIPSFLKIPKPWKKYLKIGLTFSFLAILIGTQGTQAYNSLKGAYPPILRITPAQYELTEWVQENIPVESAPHLRGTLTYPKKGFILVLSRRSMDKSDKEPENNEMVAEGIIKEGMIVPKHLVNGNDWVIPKDFVIFDYSDLILIGDQNKIQSLNEMEKRISNNTSLVYNKNNIKVYKFD
ncbi:glycosyltransferase family 39 protein [Candidatus Woesearchaeota archaeon]|nr:glycosyltransferase family 39 protein [Candidatus Woesearchaeota archaeon]